MPGATFSAFEQCTSASTSATDWMTGPPRWFKDVTTGKFVCFMWADANGTGTVQLWVKDSIRSPARLVSTAASNTSNPHLDMVIGVVQSADGYVHAVGAYNNLSLVQYYYSRYSLTIVNGDITGYSISYNMLSLPIHSADSGFDPRASIDIWKLAGTEYPVICWSAAFSTDTVYSVYMCYINTTSGVSPASVGMDGTGSDTLVYSRSVSAVNNHGMQCLLGQVRSSETGYLVIGAFNTDYYTAPATNSDYNLRYIPLTRSGSYWAVGSTSDFYTFTAGADQPMVCQMQSATDYAYVCYYTGASGLVIGRWDSSGTWSATWLTVTSTTSLAYFSSFTVNPATGKCYAHYIGYNSLGATATGYYAIYDGSTWNISPDPTAAKAESFYASTGWEQGLVCMRGITGDTAGQTRSGNQVGIVTDISPSEYPTRYRTVKRKIPGGVSMGLDIREWF